jgi:hypothetical protein
MNRETNSLNGISHPEFSPVFMGLSYKAHSSAVTEFPSFVGGSSSPVVSKTRTYTDGTSQEPGFPPYLNCWRRISLAPQ